MTDTANIGAGRLGHADQRLEIGSQPDNVTCGPTCLHAVYRHYGDNLDLDQVITACRRLDHGGSLDVFLALDAMERGYTCTIYPYNMTLFDPTWFEQSRIGLADLLRQQAKAKAKDARLGVATEAYLEYLQRGGKLLYRDLTSSLIRSVLSEGTPILTGLNVNYLYRSAREIPENCVEDSIRGEPCGHFVVLYGYDTSNRYVLVADPYRANPLDRSQCYKVGVERLIGAIFLGALTFDSNLLIIGPQKN